MKTIKHKNLTIRFYKQKPILKKGDLVMYVNDRFTYSIDFIKEVKMFDANNSFEIEDIIKMYEKRLEFGVYKKNEKVTERLYLNYFTYSTNDCIDVQSTKFNAKGIKGINEALLLHELKEKKTFKMLANKIQELQSQLNNRVLCSV
jgi:hypothetical protein